MDLGEPARLQGPYDYDSFDTSSEPDFDPILRMTGAIFDKPICMLHLVDKDRLWFKAPAGLDLREMPGWSSFCDEAMGCAGVTVVPDARLDTRVASAPCVAAAPHVRFYAGAPLKTPGGARIGSLHVIDLRPDHGFLDRQCGMLADMARIVMDMIEARSRQLQLAQKTREIGHMSRHDPLTGLGNRRQLQSMMEEAARSQPEAGEVMILYLDLDGFKAVNDAFGHNVGDRLLCQVADRLRTAVETPGHVVRIGGDEFAVVGFGCRALRSGAALAARLVEALGRPYRADGEEIRIGVSVGMAMGRGPDATMDRLLGEADKALYRAKTEGRGRYCVFDSGSASWERVEPRRVVSGMR